MSIVKAYFVALGFLNVIPLSRLYLKEKVRENSGPESKEKKGKKGTQFQQTLLDLYVIFTIKSKIGTQVELFRPQQHSRKYS